MKLLLAIPLPANELPLAKSLLHSLSKLGPYEEHSVLFVTDHGTERTATDPILELAKPLFQRGELIHTPLALPEASYPRAHNFRFETAARHIGAARKVPFLWLDPRCVPTHRGWLRDIEEEYFGSRKPFMGALMEPATHGTPAKWLSGVACYPAELPKRMIQFLVGRRSVDWEQSCADIVVPNAHPAKTIAVLPKGQPISLERLPRKAALIQTAEPARLTALLRGEPIINEPTPEAKPIRDLSPLPAAVATPPGTADPRTEPAVSRAAYYHSGNLGDVIYALSAIKLAGGGKIIIGPRQRRTSPAGNPIKEPAFKLMAPLLKAQPYITEARYSDRHPGSDAAFDLNTFRDHWNDRTLRARVGANTLAAMHAYTLGVLPQWRPSQTWLIVPNPITTGMFAVHRSARYRNEAFPWGQVVDQFRSRLLFVGLASEHADFQRDFRCRTAFFSCGDFLQMARIIAGSLGFIGNQSFPCAIALGLGQRVLQESWAEAPDCVLPRGNFLTQPFTAGALEAWEKSTL